MSTTNCSQCGEAFTYSQANGNICTSCEESNQESGDNTISNCPCCGEAFTYAQSEGTICTSCENEDSN